jgi:hypothetical protein
MTDRELLVLIERYAAAKAAREAASDALEAARADHMPGVGAAVRLRWLTRAFNALADEYDGLKLVLWIAPVSTPEGGIAKSGALLGDADPTEVIETTLERWNAGDAAIVAAVDRGLEILGLG